VTLADQGTGPAVARTGLGLPQLPRHRRRRGGVRHRGRITARAARLARPAVRPQGTGPGPHGYEIEPRSRSVEQGITGHLLNDVTEPVIEQVFKYWKNVDRTVGNRVQDSVRDGQD
jgi:hypothetical protein